jgi:diguanylate cyclase (GGDEF)-like protein/PAS domain S-box-containing protein
MRPRLSIGIKFGFCLGLLGALLAALAGYYLYDRSRELLIHAVDDKLLAASQTLGRQINRSVAGIEGDLLLMAALPEVRQIATLPASAPAAGQARAQLAEIFGGLLTTRNHYIQARLVGVADFGRELVRVERNERQTRGWRVVPDSEFQEKNHLPYVYETLRLAPGKLYFPPVSLDKDLDAGFGKPMLHIATPIPGADGKPFGVLVLDVALDGLLTQIREHMPAGMDVLLTNSHGDYLVHPDVEKIFGFDRGRRFRIQDDMPAAMPLFSNKPPPQVIFRLDDTTLGQPAQVALVRIAFDALPANRFLVAGFYTPLENALAESRQLGQRILQNILLFITAAILLSFLLVRIMGRPLNQVTQTVRQHALGKPLPPLPVARNDEIGDLARSFTEMAQQLDRQLHAQQATEAQLHAILDNAPLGIWLTDPGGRYRFVNATWCAALGIDEARFIAANSPADILGEEIAVFAETSNQRCLLEEKPVHLQTTQIFADGKLHYLEITKVKLADDTGHIVGIVGIANDVSERLQREAREKLRSNVLEQLAGGAALDAILPAIVADVEQQNPDLRCAILLLDDTGQHLRLGAAPSMPGSFKTLIDGLPLIDSPSFGAIAAGRGQRVIFEDVFTASAYARYRELARELGVGSAWAEPVRSTKGRILGAFVVYQGRIATPNENDLRLIEQAAHLTAIAIERSRHTEELKLAAMVYQHSNEAIVVTDADNRIVAINPAFTRLTGYLPDEAIGRDPRILNSNHHDAAFFREFWATLLSSGQWQGELWNRHKNGEIAAEALRISAIFDADGKPYRYVALYHDVTEKRLSEETIWRQANYDAQTGLPNRRMFHDRLRQAIKTAHRSGLPMALMFIDLDRFKEVNDTFGHAMGDALLHEAARRIADCVRETDTVARVGGDEFTVILGEITEADSVNRIAQKIRQRLAEAFALGSEKVYISASVGITLYPDDGADTDALVKNADQAMYAAKNAGRNRIGYFTAAMQKNAQERMRIAAELRDALLEKQFTLHYQPVIDLRTGAICKAEALIRWQHPTRGMVRPDSFIPIAEDTGLIVGIGDWVFFEATRQCAVWRAKHCQSIQIGVNKSPVQFRGEADEQKDWFAHLHDLGFPGDAVVIEITEGVLLDTTATTSQRLRQLQEAGLQLSLDDFGTGYSSLAYLKKFDIDYIKIDQSFVRNLTAQSEDLAICEAMIVMAHKLGIRVVAEGIETQQQRDLLAAAGCDFGQGYLFSRPLPAADFESLLQTGMLYR